MNQVKLSAAVVQETLHSVFSAYCPFYDASRYTRGLTSYSAETVQDAYRAGLDIYAQIGTCETLFQMGPAFLELTVATLEDLEVSGVSFLGYDNSATNNKPYLLQSVGAFRVSHEVSRPRGDYGMMQTSVEAVLDAMFTEHSPNPSLYIPGRYGDEGQRYSLPTGVTGFMDRSSVEAALFKLSVLYGAQVYLELRA